MSTKERPAPRPLDRVGIRLKGWTAAKVSAFQQKRKAKKAA